MFNQIIYPLTLFLTPLLFFTFTPNFFATPKQLLLILVVLLIALNWLFKLAASRTLQTSSSPLRLGLIAFVIALLLNLVLHKEGRLESLVGPTAIYLVLSVWTYFLTLQKNSQLHQKILSAFLGSTTILAIHTILQLTLLSRLTFLPLYLQLRSFTLTGNLLTTLILIGLGIAVAISRLRASINHQPSIINHGLSSIIHLIAFVALGYLLLPGHELALNILPLTASWSIALDAMKSIRTFFFGVGLANFAIFYKSVKPLFLNTTPFWSTLPSSSGSAFLHLLTTTGVIGFISFLSLPLLTLKSLLKDLRSKQNHDPLTMSYKLIFFLSTLALLLSPSSIPLLLVFFTTLGVLNASDPHTRSLTRPLSLILALVILVLTLVTGYYSALIITAEINMRQAQKALSSNNGKLVYEKNIVAINLLPGLTSYHLSASQVNLSIAAALSQQASLSDTNRQNITQLVSQAIREGKLAVNLSPNDSAAWQNLGSLYRNLVNVAEGADQYAIQSYARAVALDPANPLLRLEFGGFLYQLGGSAPKASDMTALYSRAQNEFQTAIQLKPDYPNAYYNLAKLFETNRDYQNAYLAMQKTLSLLGPDSADLARTTSELESIKAKLPSSSPSTINHQPSTISEPSPLPSPLPGGPIELPTDIEPTQP
ncbi:MAG: tetratricopeptide repeat protein [bacterium]